MAIMDRRTFFGISAAGALAAASTTLEGKVPEAIKDFVKDKSLKIKFMGTGSAGGIGKNGLGRRHSSILVNDDFIIDFTDDSLDMIPAGVHPETIFYTHSHKDHFQPSTALKIGIKKVYLSHSWYDIAVTPLLANHPTDYIYEEAQIYLIEKDGVRLLYATDTSGIPGKSARHIGIDKHREGYGINALIMEATSSDPDDFRLYCHSSTDIVEKTVRVLLKTDRLHMPEGQKVYITHMSRKLHPKNINETLPEPLRAAEDGLEVIFRAP